MKHLKALGLAALAVAAMTALMGAANAQATVLCKTTLGAECGAEKWGVGTNLNNGLEIGSEYTLRNTLGGAEVECGEASQQIVIENAGGAAATVVGKIATASMSFATCGTTTVTAVSGGEVEFHWLMGTFNATVTAKGISVKFVKGALTCIYGLGAAMVHAGTLTGGLPGRIHFKALATKQAGSSATCQTDQYLEAEWEILPNGELKGTYARER